jgi:hypothetical protein
MPVLIQQNTVRAASSSRVRPQDILESELFPFPPEGRGKHIASIVHVTDPHFSLTDEFKSKTLKDGYDRMRLIRGLPFLGRV